MEPRLESKWIDAFRRVFEMCAVRASDAVAILSETQSRPLNVRIAEMAGLGRGARAEADDRGADPLHRRLRCHRRTRARDRGARWRRAGGRLHGRGDASR